MKKASVFPTLLIILALSLTACSSLAQTITGLTGGSPAQAAAPLAQATSSLSTLAPAQPTAPLAQAAAAGQAQAQAATPVAVQATLAPNSFLAAYEGTLESIYSQVNPSVVSIHVLSESTVSSPFGRRGGSQTQTSEALGSGFVWDTQGHIVTNNHVVAGATSVDVTFSDGRNYPAKVVGTDVYSDLAVIQVSVAAAQLHPVTIADSKLVKVGQIGIAIGNPYGLSNTMTVGVISALGRTLPAGSAGSTGLSYTIPDIIQTDAPINPGNSGGVLLDDQGQVLGVTAAIASNTDSSAGIGFVIPSAIVKRVVPALISTGAYEHPYLGISGISLNAALNTAMNLNVDQQGALVEAVTPGGPADKAGLRGSASQSTTINGQQTPIGGDVIIAANGQTVKGMDDLIAYLESNAGVGQKLALTVLRDGKQVNLEVTVGARPAQPITQVLPAGLNPASQLIMANIPLNQ
jgi:S1-C subfamily serine protease